ncbi:MAG: hypothetical protein ACI4ES_16225 [Roseburia sp.]
MYECPNCGGNLRFDIPTQSLLCDYCHTVLDPYSYQKDHDAMEENMYDVTIFTCPQCGGEILSTENAATGFCSFCGASTILDSRISKERRPNYIIPFQRTKEDCKTAYSSFMKHAIFAPKELKDARYIDNFRGIYMPYWAYYLSQEGTFSVHAKKEYQKGNYHYTDHFHLEGSMNSYYKGLSFDASSSFDDNISENIAPFDVRGMRQFTPSILCGFYADTADLSSDLYLEEASAIANETSIEEIQKIPVFQGYNLETSNNPKALSLQLGTECKQVDSTMFPVWFLSYRKGDRVAYATVNGQTGKVAADLPVDPKKYLLGSVLLALPIFILLNLFFTFTPKTTLFLSALFALFTGWLYTKELSLIKKREFHMDDKGFLAKKNPAGLANYQKEQREKKKKLESKKGWSFLSVLFLIVYCSATLGPSLLFALTAINQFPPLLALGIFILMIVLIYYGTKAFCELPGDRKIPGFLGSCFSIIVYFLITIFHPASDLFYYGGTIISLFSVVITVFAIIREYNILATRPLPQFERKGGNDNAA